MKLLRASTFIAPVALLIGCGGSPDKSPSVSVLPPGVVTPAVPIDKACDQAPYPSEEWTACENTNFAKTREGPAEFQNAAFMVEYNRQSNFNIAEWTTRGQEDPSWLSPQSGNTALLPACATWGEVCVSDPFQFPQSSGRSGADYYANIAEVTPFVIYDQECARLSGRIWKPRSGDGPFPGIVVQNGSVQAPEPVYWWAVQDFVENGYMVMTFDPRGQGRSDQQTPTVPPMMGTNNNPKIFWEGLVNAIDFFRSTAAKPYPHNLTCANSYPTAVTNSNPYASDLDLERLGIVGHSLGGIAVSVVQSYGAEGALEWPGLLDDENPVDVAVAWDGIYNPDTESVGNAGGNNAGANGSEVSPSTVIPAVIPQFPIMGQNGEYGISPVAFESPPDPERNTSNFRRWQDAGIPAWELTYQGATHFDYSPIANAPTTSWCPTPELGYCIGGWGVALQRHYSTAWMDRWLKLPGEIGYDTADDRLLDDNGEHGRNKFSFRYLSARDYPERNGRRQVCTDIRGGCEIIR